MLEVEDWTQPSNNNKKRLSSKRISVETQDGKEGTVTSSSKANPSVLPPGPPEPDVEDTFMVTHPTNSHLFPSRGRSDSTPPARPSSLSRLLAQASPTPERANDSISEKPSSPSPVAPEVLTTNGNTTINGGGSNTNLSPTTNTPPLRPVSRASRLSTASRFSVNRKPTLGIVAGSIPKAAATTALSEQVLTQSPSTSADNNPFRSPLTSSPDESISEAMSHTMKDIGQRRRTSSSYHPPRMASTSSQATVVPRPTSAASTTLANLASSFGMSFSRKKKAELAAGMLTPPVESPVDATIDRTESQTLDGMDGSGSSKSARDILKRF